MIGVDWRNGTDTLNYFNSVANSQITGAVVAVFIRKLMSVYKQRPDQFTLVGRSLGAHVAGFAGANFTEAKIKAIYGLDPAGPGFRNIGPRFRLDPNDASMVVTLTTDTGPLSVNGKGLQIPVGHYSFIVNGGVVQPGCPQTWPDKVPIFNTLYGRSSYCNHERPAWLVQVSARDTQACHSMGYQCASYEAFLGGQCGTCADGSGECQPLYSFFGYWSQYADHAYRHHLNQSVVYYVDTTADFPYCICHYQLIINTGEGDHFKGNFWVALQGQLRDHDAFQFKEDNFDIKPNSTYKALVKIAKNVGKLESIEIEVTEEPGWLPSPANKKIAIDSIEFNYMSALAEKSVFIFFVLILFILTKFILQATTTIFDKSQAE